MVDAGILVPVIVSPGETKPTTPDSVTVVEPLPAENVPVAPEAQPVAVPEPSPQVAEEDQPIPLPTSSIKPKRVFMSFSDKCAWM